MGRKYRVLEISSFPISRLHHVPAAAAFWTLALGVPATEELGKASGLEERGGLLGVDIV
jgi:hypothetical protein